MLLDLSAATTDSAGIICRLASEEVVVLVAEDETLVPLTPKAAEVDDELLGVLL